MNMIDRLSNGILCAPRPRRGMSILEVAAVTVATALWLSACSSGKQEQQAVANAPHGVTLTAAQQASIRLYTVQSSQFHTTISTTGIVDFDHNRSTGVLAPFSGPVVRVLATPGQTVTKGQPLATVASPDFASAIGAYRKTLAAAQAADQLATTDSDLVAHHALSQRENAQAQADAAGAESDRDAALQALVALNVDPQTIEAIRQGKPLTDTMGVIRAPLAGTLVEQSIQPGQLLQVGTTPCFTVADLSRVWVMAQVFGADVASIHPGDSAEVEVQQGTKTLQGTVANVSAEVDPSTQSVLARVELDNPDDVLKKQMYVGVRIQSNKAQAGLLIPVSAVLRDDENLPFVYVADPDGSYTRRLVDLGYRGSDRVVITSGLHAGERVVVDGAIFLRFIETQ